MDKNILEMIREIRSINHPSSLKAKDVFKISILCIEHKPKKEIIHRLLDVAHLNHISILIANSAFVDQWLNNLTVLIKLSNYHLGYLLAQRAEKYNSKIVFKYYDNNQIQNINYRQLWEKVKVIAKGILNLKIKNKPLNIGIFSPNHVKSALVDLACLSFGFKVIPIPLNVTSKHLTYILKHSEISHLFINGKRAIKLWNEIRIKHPIKLISSTSKEQVLGDVIGWESFIYNAQLNKSFNAQLRLSNVSMENTQTIMYTSGTTSDPKGIIFDQTNIIIKRFARALALPNINSQDVFLCYLPLFHTFGRYFELMGSIFWGATYVFAQAPSFNSILKDFKVHNPTIFISIPKRWVQLYEMLEAKLNLDNAQLSEIKAELNSITGGKLKWGLSAAGYLDADLFKFFNKYGINMHSGYGMTEATGGITMTPSGKYIEDSVGIPLPGIQLKIEDDGELRIKGPYVSKGYFKEKKSKSFNQGWFYTGDIFEKKNDYYFIIDRKKDIYKNSRGQTISPQKIENLFQDFDSIKSVFLIGDGREFNTLLIYPDNRNSPIDLSSIDEQKIRDIFSSMILSVNSFLAPFERIINYVIINRNFESKKGELTPKGTYIRKNVLRNFEKIISPLYEKNYLSLYHNAKEIRFPNWLLREIGTVKSHVKWDGNIVTIKNQSNHLILTWDNNIIHLGNLIYNYNKNILDIEKLIKSPAHWLGNVNFSNFSGSSIFRLKAPEFNKSLIVNRSNYDVLKNEINNNKSNEYLFILHSLVEKFLTEDYSVFIKLQEIIDQSIENNQGLIIDTFLTYQYHPNPIFRLRLIECLAPLLSGNILVKMLRDSYQYQVKSKLKNSFTFNIKRLNDEHYESLIRYLKEAHSNIKISNSIEKNFVQILILFVSEFGSIHPTRYVWARSELVWWQISDVPKVLFSTAQKAYYALTSGFRIWIGKSSNLTVDPNTGDEYSWIEAIQFDENVSLEHQKHLQRAISNTSIIKESIFLFSDNHIIGLNKIPKKGIWITHLDTQNGKSVFRLIIKTRSNESYNIVINLNEGLDKDFFSDEIKWLIAMGKGYKAKPLVENFGGYWPEYKLFTEEYIYGETLERYLYRNKNDILDSHKVDRWQMRWLHFIWNGIHAYQEFWKRTNFKLSIQPPSPENLIIPQRDYATGTKIISISRRRTTKSIAEHFLALFSQFIIMTEKRYPGLKHMSNWEVIFTATLQSMNVKVGKKILKKLSSQLTNSNIGNKLKLLGCTPKRIDDFFIDIDNFGVLTKPVIFASLRYERWHDLNPEATLQARASILQELYNDYDLDNLIDDYPETRVRFFMMTCFKDNNVDLNQEFKIIISDMRTEKITQSELQKRISNIQIKTPLSKEEKFFLARMLFPHVNAVDYVELVTTNIGVNEQLNLIFQAQANDNKIYQIRPPLVPKEIAQFHTLLTKSSLTGKFTISHEFLLVFSDRNRIVGGLFWKPMETERIHLEWVAIKQKNRGVNLSKILLNDFFKRMLHQNIKIITVGFYVEKFFSKHGFKLNKRYGGLVKKL
jgi:long-chain acyl-CoA synthetase